MQPHSCGCPLNARPARCRSPTRSRSNHALLGPQQPLLAGRSKRAALNPNPPSPQRTRQSKTRPLHTQSLSRPSFWLVGQSTWVANTQEGVRLPDNPVFSQAGLRVDPNRPPLHFAGSGGREAKCLALSGLLLITQCSIYRPGRPLEHTTLQDMWQSAHSPRLQTRRTHRNLHPKKGSTLDPT